MCIAGECKRIYDPTGEKGYIEIYFYDENKPICEAQATRCHIHEYDKNGKLNRTVWGFANREKAKSYS